MKKNFLIGALALFGVVNAQQEQGEFKIGAHVGLPVGDISKTHSVNLGVDVAYLYPIAENFKLGVTSGYSHYFGKNVDYVLIKKKHSDFGVIPVAASGQFSVTDKFFIGADLGYGFITNKKDEFNIPLINRVKVSRFKENGGFYYQPKIGFQGSKYEVFVSYKGMTNTPNIGTFNLGTVFKF